MTCSIARTIVELQGRDLRKVDDLRIFAGGREYRVTYHGGLSAYMGIDVRDCGKRKFNYFGGVGGWDCLTVKDAVGKIEAYIQRKTAAH